MKPQLIKYLLIFVLIGAMIPLKWNWETSLAKQKSYYQLNTVTLNIQLRSQMSQNLAVALLGGFRGSVADFIWLKAHDAWMNGVWYKLKEGIQLSVILQPKSIYFWDVGSWHMAYNASFGESENKHYPTQAYRIRAQRAWIDDGKSFLEEGIRNNPDSWELHFRLAWLIQDRNKYNDPMGSISEFIKAYECANAPSYVDRMIGQMYLHTAERATSKEEHDRWTLEAYKRWLAIWKGGAKRIDGMEYKIIEWGQKAEKQLNMPMNERFFTSMGKSSSLNELK